MWASSMMTALASVEGATIPFWCHLTKKATSLWEQKYKAKLPISPPQMVKYTTQCSFIIPNATLTRSPSLTKTSESGWNLTLVIRTFM